MIQELSNPLTNTYSLLKDQVLSSDFPWYFIPTTVKDENAKYASSPYFSHAVIKAPKNPNLYPTVSSACSELCNTLLQEISILNNIEINCVIRINFNLTLPLSKKHTEPHYDHNFSHKNLLVYLNSSDGDTIIYKNGNEISYSPKEDSVILFEGLHYHYLPSISRRVVMITTFV